MAKEKVVEKSQKLPSVYELIKKTSFESVTFWKPLSAVLFVYALIYFVFVMGLSLSSNYQGAVVNDGTRISEAFNTVTNQLGGGILIGSASSDTTIIVQFILFLVASMAFIWSLRKLQGLKKIKIKDAYYNGTASLVPTVIISFVLLLTLIPALISSSVLSVSLQASSTSLEITVVSIIAFVLLMLSLYLFVMFWPAFYIVSLPKTYPLQALKSSIKVTKKRRFALLRKIFIMLIIVILISFVILLISALVWSVLVPYVAYLLLFLSFGILHVYLYSLYRELL